VGVLSKPTRNNEINFFKTVLMASSKTSFLHHRVIQSSLPSSFPTSHGVILGSQQYDSISNVSIQNDMN
jgi:hypothetical protein